MASSPSLTAEAVALFRAIEQRRGAEDRIVEDPYAHWFLGPAMRAAAAGIAMSGSVGHVLEARGGALATWVLVRHRFLDDCLGAAIESGVEQVVVLGAGYDTRALRFARELDGRPVYELDLPATSRRKGAILERHASDLPKTNLHRLEIDFLTQTIDEVLVAAGFVPERRTLFLQEGVSMYLTRKAVEDTLRCVRTLGGRGSELAMDFWYMLDTPGLMGALYRFAPNLLGMIGEAVTLSVHPHDAPSLLGTAGFDIVDLALPEDLSRRYVRDARLIDPSSYVLLARTV